MEIIFKSILIYFFLMIVFRVSGRRTLGEMTTFDFVLALIVGESTSQALLGPDYSMTACLVVILTLVSLDTILAFLKNRSPKMDLWLDGAPLILVQDGKILPDRCRIGMVDKSDILSAARLQQGLLHLSEIRLAVLEIDGQISIIPRKKE